MKCEDRHHKYRLGISLVYNMFIERNIYICAVEPVHIFLECCILK